jgi:hypothetical protein
VSFAHHPQVRGKISKNTALPERGIIEKFSMAAEVTKWMPVIKAAGVSIN